MAVVEEVKRWQAMAASGKAAVDETWLALNKLVGDGRLTESEQREIVWDSFSDMHPELRKQCPYFDPQHDVWTKQESADSEKAMAELSRIMSDTNTLKGAKRVFSVVKCAGRIFMLSSFVIFIAETGVFGSLKKAISRVIFAVYLLNGPVFIIWYVKSIKLFISENLPKDTYIPVRHLSDPQAQTLSHVELEYSKSWAAANNWGLRRRSYCVSDFAMWRELDELVGGYITRFGRAQIFWDSHSPDEQSILSRECPFFDINHEVWSSNKDIRHVNNELEIAVLSGHVREEKHQRSLYLKEGAFVIALAAAFVILGLWQLSDASDRKGYLGIVGSVSLFVLVTLAIRTRTSLISTRRDGSSLRDLVKQRDN